MSCLTGLWCIGLCSVFGLYCSPGQISGNSFCGTVHIEDFHRLFIVLCCPILRSLCSTSPFSAVECGLYSSSFTSFTSPWGISSRTSSAVKEDILTGCSIFPSTALEGDRLDFQGPRSIWSFVSVSPFVSCVGAVHLDWDLWSSPLLPTFVVT